MDSIYPKSHPVEQPFALTAEEKKALKAGFVFAIEEGLKVDQDRALRALELAKFDEARTIEVKRHLWMIFYLENEVRSEVAKDTKALEEAYADGVEDPNLLSDAVACEAVDAQVFASRFADVKAGLDVLEPVLPPKPVAEPIVDPEPLDDGKVIEEKP